MPCKSCGIDAKLTYHGLCRRCRHAAALRRQPYTDQQHRIASLTDAMRKILLAAINDDADACRRIAASALDKKHKP